MTPFKIWRTLLVLIATGVAVELRAAELRAGERQERAGQYSTLTTLAGDHLTGRAVRLDCHGLSFNYFGSTLRLPFDQIASMTSEGNVPVFPGNGNDKITGQLAMNATTVSVRTRDLGQIVLPIAAFRCNGATPSGATLGGGELDADAPRRAHGTSQLAPGTGSPRQFAGLKSSAPEAAVTLGKGPSLASQSLVTPEGAAAVQGDNGGSEGVASEAPAKSPLPKEQQEESERNTLSFLRNQVPLVQPRRLEIEFAGSYLHTSQLLGNDRILVGEVQGRYGLSQGFEAFLNVPYLWGQRRTDIVTNAGPSTLNNNENGIGDLRFGLKYTVLQEAQGIPAVVVGVSAGAPTGRNPYVAPTVASSTTVQRGIDIRDPVNIQLGIGHWQLTESLTALKSNDPLVLYGTISYTHFMPAIYYGVEIKPGDILGINYGLGFAINEIGTIGAQVFVNFWEQWSFNKVAVAQTSITPISLKLSYTHIISDSDIISPSITFGVTRDATDGVVSLNYIHRF